MNSRMTSPFPTARPGDAGTGPLPPVAGDMPPSVGAFHYTRYTSPMPALVDGVEPGVHPVVIAGGGPVGMALALGLANHGVRSVVLELDDTVCVGSRAACISRRSLEIVERLGALPAFLAKGLPWTGGRSYYKTDEVFRFAMPHDDTQKLPPMINLEQYYIEHYLLQEIERRNAATPGLIDVRWNTEVTALTQHDDHVMLSVRQPAGAYQLRGAWLAACDGGQSFVRKSLGLSLEGTAYEGRYVIIDIELHSSHPTERRAWFDPPWNPGSTVLMHRQPDDIWRIDYQLREGQSTEDALQPAAVAEFVQRHLDAIGEGHLPWHTVWTSVYRAGAMTLPSYRHDRVLFAGNAAHAMPIFGVRGLNSGFDDADNLAWKLARVARGVAGTGLLDSYSGERIAAFHVNAENAMRSTEFMSPPSRGFDLLREAALSLSGRHRDIANLINPRQTQAVRYAASPLSLDSDALAAGPLPGEVMPNLKLGPDRHLSDLLQTPGFVVLAVGTEPPGSVEIKACLRQDAHLSVHVLRRGDTGEPALAALAALGAVGATGASGATGATYLLRPDSHVAARWCGRPADGVLAQALARALCLPASMLSPATLSSATMSPTTLSSSTLSSSTSPLEAS